MSGQQSSLRRVWIGVFVAGGLVLSACGGDDGGDPDLGFGDTGIDADTNTDGPTDDEILDSIAGSVDDSDLVVPRDYLQGDWCDSDGLTWSIEGDIARFGEDADSQVQVPVDLAFVDSPDEALVSQSDDEFVLEVLGEEVTFTRGAC